MKQLYSVMLMLLLCFSASSQTITPNTSRCVDGSTKYKYNYENAHHESTHVRYFLEPLSQNGSPGEIFLGNTNKQGDSGYLPVADAEIEIRWKTGYQRGGIRVQEYTLSGTDYLLKGSDSNIYGQDGKLGVLLFNSQLTPSKNVIADYGVTTITLTAEPANPLENFSYVWGALPAGMTYLGTGKTATIRLTECATGTVTVKGNSLSCGKETNVMSFNITRRFPTSPPQYTVVTPECEGASSISLNSPVTGYSYRWEVSSTQSSLRFSGGATTAYGASTTFTGKGYVRLISAICGKEDSRTIELSGDSYQVSAYRMNNIMEVSVQPVAGATGYRWYKNGMLMNYTTVPYTQIGIWLEDCENSSAMNIMVEAYRSQCSKYVYVGSTSVNSGPCSYDCSDISIPCHDPSGLNSASDDFELVEMLAYPNPASNELSITANKNGKAFNTTFTLYDSSGNARKSGKTLNGKLKIVTSDLADGLYYLKTSNGRYTKSTTIMIKR